MFTPFRPTRRIMFHICHSVGGKKMQACFMRPASLLKQRKTSLWLCFQNPATCTCNVQCPHFWQLCITVILVICLQDWSATPHKIAHVSYSWKRNVSITGKIRNLDQISQGSASKREHLSPSTSLSDVIAKLNVEFPCWLRTKDPTRKQGDDPYRYMSSSIHS